MSGAKRGTGRLQELQSWCWESREWLLGQGGKGLVCSNRKRLVGEVELRAWIKQKIKTNMWKGENGQKGDVSMYMYYLLCTVLFK